MVVDFQPLTGSYAFRSVPNSSPKGRLGRTEMIVLDTHVWIWLADESERLTSAHQRKIDEHRASGLGVSAISCWEIAKPGGVRTVAAEDAQARKRTAIKDAALP